MDRKYDLMNNTESENAEDYKVPKQPTELECKGGYMEDLKRPPYMLKQRRIVSDVSMDIVIILQLNTKRKGLENVIT